MKLKKGMEVSIHNYFAVAPSMVTEECKTRHSNKVVRVFSLFLQFSPVFLISVFPHSSSCLPSLILVSPLHLPQQVRQPSCVTPLSKIHKKGSNPLLVYFNLLFFPPEPSATLLISCSSCPMNIAWIIDLTLFCLLDQINLPDCSIYWCKLCKIKAD